MMARTRPFPRAMPRGRPAATGRVHRAEFEQVGLTLRAEERNILAGGGGKEGRPGPQTASLAWVAPSPSSCPGPGVDTIQVEGLDGPMRKQASHARTDGDPCRKL